MTRTCVTKGKTVEIAIRKALQKLGVRQEDTDIEILRPGRKGFLGIGAKPAVVQVTVRGAAVFDGQAQGLYEHDVPPWDLRLSDDRMEARLVVRNSGQKGKSIPIDESQVLQRLGQMRVTEGIDHAAIRQACQSGEPGEYVIARGQAPEHGQDGYFEQILDLDADPGQGRTDFPIAKEGELIGIIHPPLPGRPGLTVTGESVDPPEVYPLHAVMGDGVDLVDGNRGVCKLSGFPEIFWGRHFIKVYISPKFRMDQDVDLNTGNVRHFGELEIAGSVRESMQVEASGNVLVHRNVNKARIIAGKSAIICDHVISSHVTTGKNGEIIAELLGQLDGLTMAIRQMLKAIEQLQKISAFKLSSFSNTGLGPLLAILYEGRLRHFTQLASDFVYLVRQHEDVLYVDWLAFCNMVEQGLLRITQTSLQSVDDIRQIAEQGEQLQWMYADRDFMRDNCFLQAASIQDSEVHVNGDIVVTGSGSHFSKLRARGAVRVENTARGGEIFAEQGITVGEAGSPQGEETWLKVPFGKEIAIGKAYENTRIQIGTHIHRFDRETARVRARIDHNGDLILH